MSEQAIAPFSRVAEIQGRVLELARRIERDSELLLAAQRELSTAVGQLQLAWPSPPAPPLPTGAAILRAPAVCSRIGLGRSSLWRLVQIGRFPAQRRLSGRAVGWLDTEVTAWIEARDADAPTTSRR